MLPPAHDALDEERAWTLLLALARRAGRGDPVVGDSALRLGDDGTVEEEAARPSIVARPSTARGWSPPDGGRFSRQVELLLDLYMPLCVGAGRDALSVGHLAQTLDGRIAISSGQSQFISGEEDLTHCHRLRALFDVIVVGRRTVEQDDPRLTARRCVGPSPLRVVIDPERRLGTSHRVFQGEPGSTLVFCKAGAAPSGSRHGSAEVVAVEPASGGLLPVPAIVAELRRRGLRRVYVEGGGLTVSRFLEAGVLSRLQVTVAPMLFGSGRPSFTLPEIPALSQALAVEWRHFALGRDVLFDCAVKR